MTETKAMGGTEIAAGIAGLVVAGLGWIEALSFPLQDLQEGLGAAFFPRLILGIIAILSVCLIINGLVHGFRFTPPFERGRDLGTAGKLFAAFACFSLAFGFFGLAGPVIAFLIVAMRILGASWRRAVGVGSAMGAGIYGLFVVGFGVPMP